MEYHERESLTFDKQSNAVIPKSNELVECNNTDKLDEKMCFSKSKYKREACSIHTIKAHSVLHG